MPTKGERCFSRWLLSHKEVSGGLFSRLLSILIYALFLGIITLAHKGILMYVYYRFMERYDEDPIPAVFIDGIASYIGPAYCILLFVVLCFLLCACCGVACKARHLIHWTVALLTGATALSVLSYAAQMILYTFRLILMFMEKKVLLVAMCYCASMTHNSNISDTTTQLMTSPALTTQTVDVTTSLFYSENTTDNSIADDGQDENEKIENVIIDENPDEMETEHQMNKQTHTSSTEGNYWCQCDIPYEDYPLGVSTVDPNDIDSEFLMTFGVDYAGDVTSMIVSNTEEVRDKTDVSFTDEKMFTAVLQGIVVILALRVPLWLVLNNLWCHIDHLDHVVQWQLGNRAHIAGVKQPRQNIGRRLWQLVERADAYINYDKNTQNVNGWPDGGDRVESSTTYIDGLLDGIRKGRTLPQPPSTIGAALALLFYCLLALVDSFCLLDEFFYRRHHFRYNMTLTYATLSAIGATIVATMILNFLTIFPSTKRNQAYHVTRFLCVIFTNAPHLVLRLYLFVVYNFFTGNELQSSFLVFIIAELVALIVCTVDFGMEMDYLKQHKVHKPVSSLTKWRNYQHGLRPESESSGYSASPQGFVNVGGEFGETADHTSSTDDDASSTGEVFYHKEDTDYAVGYQSVGDTTFSKLDTGASTSQPSSQPVKPFYTAKPIDREDSDNYTASLYNNHNYNQDGPIYSKPDKDRHGKNEYKPENTRKDHASTEPRATGQSEAWYQRYTIAPTKSLASQSNTKDHKEQTSGGFNSYPRNKKREEIINEAVQNFKPKYTEDELRNMVFYI